MKIGKRICVAFIASMFISVSGYGIAGQLVQAKPDKTLDKACHPLKDKHKDKDPKSYKKDKKTCAPATSVAFSAGGCTITVASKPGSVVVYGAYSGSKTRGWESTPTIVPDSGSLTVSTGGDMGMVSYVKVTGIDGIELAYHETPVTAESCVTTIANGGYPAKWADAPIDSIVDPWGMYNRQPASYTAFRVWASGRYMPYWGGSGNSNQWDDNARAAGIPVDKTPKAGDVAISNSGAWGHAMYVEKVNADGSIDVSDYSQQFDGLYREYPLSASIVSARGLVFIHFSKE